MIEWTPRMHVYIEMKMTCYMYLYVSHVHTIKKNYKYIIHLQLYNRASENRKKNAVRRHTHTCVCVCVVFDRAYLKIRFPSFVFADPLSFFLHVFVHMCACDNTMTSQALPILATRFVVPFQ